MMVAGLSGGRRTTDDRKAHRRHEDIDGLPDKPFPYGDMSLDPGNKNGKCCEASRLNSLHQVT